MFRGILERHALSYQEESWWSPIIRDVKGDLVPTALGAAAGGLLYTFVAGDAVAGTGLAAAAAALALPVEAGWHAVQHAVKGRSHPLRKHLGIDPGRTTLLRGLKKDQGGNLVTMKFQRVDAAPDARAEVDRNDQAAATRIAGLLGRESESFYSAADLLGGLPGAEAALEGEDMVAVGGPIPIEFLKPWMAGPRRLPFHFNISQPTPYTAEEMGAAGRTFYKYEVKTPAGDHVPEWNRRTYGILTVAPKDMFIRGSEGLFLNVAGCNGFGTLAASEVVSNPRLLDATMKKARDRIGRAGSFQVVVGADLQDKRVVASSIGFVDAVAVP